MRKIICYVLCICMCLGLSGCVSDFEETTIEKESNEESTLDGYDNPYIKEYIYPYTGVHYLIYSESWGSGGMGGITPRLNSDGTIMITE